MSISPYSSSIFKRSTIHFLTGKAATAFLTLITLLWLVRLLTVEGYGVYVVLMAGMEISLAVTALGLPWVAMRYLPEFRLYASGGMLTHFVWQVIYRISLILVVGALLLFLVLPWLLSLLELDQYTNIAKLYLIVLIIEGLGRHIRESILAPLMQQGYAQISQVARNSALLLVISIAAAQGTVHLWHVVLAELVASLLGTLLALLGLLRYLYICRDLPGQDGWQLPNWLEMWRIARFMYFSSLVTHIYSPQMFVFLIQHYLGVEATAMFGFLRSLYEQISRYLPATLLSNLIRPKLVASFVGSGGMAELTRDINLVGKLSLFALMPILIFAWLAGSDLPNLLSGGKFSQSDYFLGSLLLALIPLSQRQILEFVAVASEKSHLCSLGALFGVLTLPLAFLLLELDQGLWSIIIAIIVGQISFDAIVAIALSITTAFRLDIIGFFKLIMAALAVFVLAQQLVVPVRTWLDLFFIGMLSCGLFLLVAYFIKPFHIEERARLNRLFNIKFFVW